MTVAESDSLDFAPAGCRKRHQLERLRAGELSGAESDALNAHAATCATCQATLRELDANDAQVRSRLPLEKLRAKLDAPVAKVIPLRRFAKVAPVVGLALAASLVALVLARPPAENRTKGGIALEVYVGGVGEARRVDPHEFALNPGERVQLKVDGNGHKFVAVVSVDESGEVSPDFFAGEQSMPLEGREEMLPQSIAFDGHGRERIIVVFSNSPLQREDVERSAREAFRKSGDLAQMGSLALPDGAEELDRTVLKP